MTTQRRFMTGFNLERPLELPVYGHWFYYSDLTQAGKEYISGDKILEVTILIEHPVFYFVFAVARSFAFT